MKTLLGIFVICMTANAQSREELHKKYGLSSSETFAARPGIFVTVSYAETGEVCEMIIHSQPLTSSLNYPITKTMASKALNEMIDDLVPMNQRGRLLMGEFLNITCLPLDNCSGTSESYERITITRIGGADKHRYATIHWKAAACRK